jgi:hypothetical protein
MEHIVYTTDSMHKIISVEEISADDFDIWILIKLGLPVPELTKSSYTMPILYERVNQVTANKAIGSQD